MMVRRNSGFTLIEITMILVLLGIFASVTAARYYDMSEDARFRAAVSSAAELQARLNACFGENMLGGMNCANAKSHASTIENIADDGARKFGEYEFETETKQYDSMTLRYRYGETGVFQPLSGFTVALPVCEGESRYPTLQVGIDLYKRFMNFEMGSGGKYDEKATEDGWTFSASNRDGYYKFFVISPAGVKIEVGKWKNNGINGVDQISIHINNKEEDKKRISNSSSSVQTNKERANLIEIFKNNFPHWEEMFTIETTKSGFQYVVPKAIF